MDSSLPGISLTMDSGKKKILLLKKDRDNPVVSFIYLRKLCRPKTSISFSSCNLIVVERIMSFVYSFSFVNVTAFQNSTSQPEQQMETNLSGSSLTSRQDQKIVVGGRLIKGILLRNEPRPTQPSSFVQPESRVEPLEAENSKRPPRPANTRAGYKGVEF